MEKKAQVLPAEIEKFFISKESLESILSEVLEGEVESIEVNDDEVNVSLSIDFLTGIFEEAYQRNIETVDLDGDEVKVTLGEQMEDSKKK